MTDEVSICNQALGWLGANLITNLQDSSIEAQLCYANYATLRDTVQEEGRWTFCRNDYSWGAGVRQPSQSYRWAYQFPIPFDVLTVQRVFRDTHGTVADWERMGQFIMTNCEMVYVNTINRVEDPDLMTKTFTQALAYRIAAELAVPLTQDTQLAGLYEQKYQLRLNEALAVDGQQGRNESTRAGPLITARNGGMITGIL